MKDSTKKNIRIGLLGFGSMGKTHAYAVENLRFFYQDLPFSAEIAGVCTTSMEKSQRVCQEYGFSIATTDEDILINDPDIDVIDVCSPNIFHFESLKKAIAAGKHIYCEKPLCISLSEAEEVAELARKSDKIHNIVFNNRYIPAIMRAKELVDEGRLGRILSFRIDYQHSSATVITKNAGWKQDREICGGGVLFDLGSHVIDLIYHLCGRFTSVCAATQIAFPVRAGRDGRPWETNADEAVYMLARLECGAVGTIGASKIAVGANSDIFLEIFGERGAIRFSLMEPSWLYFFDNTVPEAPLGGMRGYTRIEAVGRYPAPGGVFPPSKSAVGWTQGHVHSMYRFLDSVYTGKQNSPDFDDAMHVQAVMEAAYASATSMTWETVG